jgi:hypothetical protein
VEMDKLAKAYLPIAMQSPRHYLIQSEPWSIWIGDKKVCKDFSTTIYEVVHAEEAKQYWLSKSRVSQEGYDATNWDALGKAMEESSRSKRVFMMKHTAGMCGVGKFMLKWKQRDNPNCPRCGQFEDAPHVWTCQGCEANDVWKESLDKLNEWMSSIQTDPDIQDGIIAYLNGWRYDSMSEPLLPSDIYDLILYQSTQGWRTFFEGWIPIAWEETQQSYYSLLKSRRTGRRWTICLIKKLWDIAWDLWNHRNGILHHSENILALEEQREMDQRIKTTYETFSHATMPVRDTYLFRLPLKKLLLKDYTYKKTWLQQVQQATSSTRHRLWARSLRGMRHSMHRWLYSA